MAEDVPAREVAVTGDCGFKGNGGGARSGSELSHLLLLSLRQRPGIECDCLVRGLCPYIVLEDGEETRLGKKKGSTTYMGTRARLESNEPVECTECVECLDRGRSP